MLVGTIRTSETGWVQCTNCSASGCGSTWANPSMLEKPRYGTETGSHLLCVQCCNGSQPAVCLMLSSGAEIILWPPHKQGSKMLGIPFGHLECVVAELAVTKLAKCGSHEILVETDFGQSDFGHPHWPTTCPEGQGPEAAGVSHDNPREPKHAHLRVPVFKNTTKIQREDTQRGKKKKRILRLEKGQKERQGGPGEVGPGKGGPGKGCPGKRGPEKDGEEHDQTKTLKPHTETVKHSQTHTNTHKHEVGSAKVGFGRSRFWPKSAIPQKH